MNDAQEECIDMNDATPPWLVGKPSLADDVSLHDEIQLFCKWISPTKV